MTVPPIRHAMHAGMLLALLALAVYLPFQVFGVLPYTRAYAVSADDKARLLQGVTLPDYYALVAIPVSAEEERLRSEDFLWCRFCHTLRAGEAHRVGPNLNRIVGQPAGTVGNFAYSAGFLQARDNGVIWTPETLDSFLSDPHNYVPGNRMRLAPIVDPEQRRRVIAKLIEATR
jgi:cytochrome c2